MADFTRDNKTYSSQYADIPGYQDIFHRSVESAGGAHSDSDQARADILKQINSNVDLFKNQYTNLVGRAPTNDEIGKFLADNGGPVQSLGSGQELRNKVVQYVGDTFQKQAQDTATQKTSDLASQYGSLADQYMEMGKKSLGDLSDSLKTYSTSLFEKLRPQLNLAAQAGGYADSGGQTLQEQGALTDLANQGQGVLGQATYDVENNANNIRYGGMAAPVSMSAQFAANQPYALQTAANGATGFGNTDFFNNQQYQQQLGLLAAERAGQPSFGTQLWQQLATGAAKGFTGGLGNQLNKFAYDKYGGAGGSGGGGGYSYGGGGTATA